MRFEFATAARVVFGPGTVREGIAAACSLGRRLLVVTGRTGLRPVLPIPEDRFMFAVADEPTVGAIRCGTALARDEGCDVVVAIGGGSAIDAGKAQQRERASGAWNCRRSEWQRGRRTAGMRYGGCGA